MPLALGVDAASLLSLGWAAASPALSAALPQLNAANPAPPNSLHTKVEAPHAAHEQIYYPPDAQGGYDSDATVVPSGNADTEPPAVAGIAHPAIAETVVKLLQPSVTADLDAAQPAVDRVPLGTPSWLPAALGKLQATAVVCGNDGEGTPVIGRRVAFALLGELTVCGDGKERMLAEGLYVGRQSMPLKRRMQMHLRDEAEQCCHMFLTLQSTCNCPPAV